ncbi:auxin-responsive protein SAUR36-like [Vitis riparia]|uniref:auxin-responsive protein SAUR36-like n=1 Tax=Vitis riparia TaxID=96939 RepID=UPI00155A20A2|nr:auxin-responsive protein SAUR36-like [Vitis riparia]
MSLLLGRSALSESLIVRMDSVKGKGKKTVMLKAWERWQSICPRAKKSILIIPVSPSKTSEVGKPKKKSPMPPKGYFPVYVGDQKQRFVIKTQLANHPLFKMLLEEAELEYGYSNGGPVLLPCDVDTFYEVLAEMESGGAQESSPRGGTFSFLSPSPRPGCGEMAEGYGHYSLLSPSGMVR